MQQQLHSRLENILFPKIFELRQLCSLTLSLSVARVSKAVSIIAKISKFRALEKAHLGLVRFVCLGEDNNENAN